MSLERDSRLGKYIIRQRLAGGGMGVVYRARDAQLGREVALKTILADKAADQDFISRFKREALSIAQIDHPNIVSLIDFVEGDPSKGEIAYMVMEYLKGKDLDRLIKDTGPLQITRAVDRILEVCAAVGACHRRGFLHRDLTPKNIFITEYDHIETAKVLDFGVAKIWAEHTEPSRSQDQEDLTQKGIFIGTFQYTAPERLKHQAATPKADQYAIGVILYAALTARKPFVAAPKADIPDLALLQQIVQGNHRKPREIRSEIPQGLEDAIERAMSINPDDRFRDLHELGGHLLPWASPAANHRWTAHFTSAPPSGNSLKLSTANDVNTRDSTIPPPFTATKSTVADHPDRSDTRVVGTDELIQAGQPDAAAARKVTTGTGWASPSLAAAVIEETSSQSAADPSIRISEVRRPLSFAALSSRPKALLIVGGLALLTATVVAALLHRATPSSSPNTVQPPAVFTTQPLPAPRPVTPIIPPVEVPPVTPGVSVPASAPAASPRIETTAPSKKHRRKPPRQQAVDQKGFPIPSY